MLTGPGQMPNFSNGNLSPAEKRDVIAYLYSLRECPTTEASPSAGSDQWPRACRLGRRHRTLVGFAIWLAAHSTRSNKKKEEATA